MQASNSDWNGVREEGSRALELDNADDMVELGTLMDVSNFIENKMFLSIHTQFAQLNSLWVCGKTWTNYT